MEVSGKEKRDVDSDHEEANSCLEICSGYEEGTQEWRDCMDLCVADTEGRA